MLELILYTDEYITHCLISAPQVVNYFSQRIGNSPYVSVILSKLTQEDLEIVLSSENMLDLINNQMSDSKFLELLTWYQDKVNLLVSKLFRDRLFKVDSNKLQEFMINNYNLIKDTIRKIPSEERKDFYNRIHGLNKTRGGK